MNGWAGECWELKWCLGMETCISTVHRPCEKQEGAEDREQWTREHIGGQSLDFEHHLSLRREDGDRHIAMTSLRIGHQGMILFHFGISSKTGFKSLWFVLCKLVFSALLTFPLR